MSTLTGANGDILPDAMIRPPAVAGSFYPADPTALATMLDRLLAEAPRPEAPPALPFAIIVPHAGYVYSGPIAAEAYAQLRPFADQVRRVVLIGPAHRVGFRGIAVSTAAAFQTPLGLVNQDRAAIERLLALPQVVASNEAHRLEHSLEVHLPFLQRVLGEFTLVALVAGNVSPQAVAYVLAALCDEPGTLLVVSTDLSHYLPSAGAQEIDRATVAAIVGLKPEEMRDEGACGCIPVKALLYLARERALAPLLLDLRNSGDTAGSKDRVVGYASLRFDRRPSDHLSVAEQNRLLDIAEASIRHGLRHGSPLVLTLEQESEGLRRPGACFVTLTCNGALRGCMGSLIAHRPLGVDAAANASAAAFKDPRFAPLTGADAGGLAVDVSVLTAPLALPVTSEADLLGRLRPQTDGLILQEGQRRATFLPHVWHQLPDPRLFLAHLKRKAGLDPQHWSSEMRFWRYSTYSFARDANLTV